MQLSSMAHRDSSKKTIDYFVKVHKISFLFHKCKGGQGTLAELDLRD